MIYLVSNQSNDVSFASTMPVNFTFTLEDEQNREVTNVQAVNVHNVNTKTRIKLPILRAGEYTYFLKYNQYILETGIAVIDDKKTNQLTSYAGTNRYKAYESNARLSTNE